jgi:hypothetical protein
MKWEQGEESQNIEDRRGQSTKRNFALGGIGTLILMLVGAYFGIDPRVINQFIGVVQNVAPPARLEQKRDLTAAEIRVREFNSKILRFTEKVWDAQFRRIGKNYTPPKMVLFEEAVDTGCGNAPSAVGPFYCPADQTVYLDPTFFDELAGKLKGSKAEFSQAYVLAHEVGHHVQNLLGYSRMVDQKRRTESKTEYNKWSVRLELQADYLAGVWAHHGQAQFQFIEPGDIESAIQSANAIGDDRLQKNSRGFTSPESYTHGTSAQRVKWFKLGLRTGNLEMMREIFEMPYGDL